MLRRLGSALATPLSPSLDPPVSLLDFLSLFSLLTMLGETLILTINFNYHVGWLPNYVVFCLTTMAPALPISPFAMKPYTKAPGAT